MAKNKDRLGEISISNEGYKMKIIKYNNAHDILIEFQDDHKTKVNIQYSKFKNGGVKNPFHPSVYGIGYLGEGKYKSKENNKHTKTYKVWYDMLQRCYDPYYLNKYETYINVYVCKEWLNFQNFGKWFEKNYYEIEGEKMCLDKDILVKGNKIYSPETCIFVPERINVLFVKKNKNRGKYPIGVCWYKKDNKFGAGCSILDENNERKIKHLGSYSTSEEAFLAYKVFKENYIKKIADEYKELIPNKLYDALYRYEVNIGD